MIVDRLDNLKLYESVNRNLKDVINYIENTDLYKLEVGKYKLNDEVNIIRESYNTRHFEECYFEGHQKYLDLQIVLTGKEYFGYKNNKDSNINITQPYNEEKDVEKYQANEFTKVILTDNMFALVFPQDLHLGKLIFDNSQKVEKVIFKIKK